MEILIIIFYADKKSSKDKRFCMENHDFLLDLVNQPQDKIIDYFYHNVVKNDMEEIQEKYNTVFTLSGTGGSLCAIKPNLSTLTSLYMTYWPDVLVIKAGSNSARRQGSSQFIRSLLPLSFDCVTIIENFVYIDTSAAFLNSAEHQYLSQQESIKKAVRGVDLYHVLGVCPTHRMTGVLNDFCAELYAKKSIKSDSNSKQIFVFSHLNGIEVDEIMFPVFYECDKNMVVKKHRFSGNAASSKFDDAETVSKMLAYGTVPKEDLFYKSLQLSFAFASLFTGRVSSIDYGMAVFKDIYQDKFLVKKFNLK